MMPSVLKICSDFKSQVVYSSLNLYHCTFTVFSVHNHIVSLQVQADFKSLYMSLWFLLLVLIDAIVKNNGTPPEEERTFTPPPGWRSSDEDGPVPHQRPRTQERAEGSGDDKKSYTEEQRQGVLRYWQE